MKVQPGQHPNTHEWVIDDFSGGSLLAIPEDAVRDRAPRCAVLISEFEIGLAGELVRRDGLASIALKDRATGFALAGAVLRVIRFERLAAQPLWVVVTPSGIYTFWPFYPAWNCEEILTDAGAPVFDVSARRADFDVLNGKLYIASPNNYLVEWDGANPAKQISKDWPEGYQKPSVIRRHAGRLLASGFMDTPDSRACSQVLSSKTANPAELEDLYEEARSGDDDMPTAMASWMVADMADASRAALVIFKRNSTHIALGTDWGVFSDISFRTISTLVGCTGPAGWCHGPDGIYFHDETGIFRMKAPTQEPEEVSIPISPCWAARRSLTNKAFPTVTRKGDEWAALGYDPKRRIVWCLLPMVVSSV